MQKVFCFFSLIWGCILFSSNCYALLQMDDFLKDPIMDIIKSEPEVRTYSEKFYDENKDGKMQQSELKVYFETIVETVNRRGYFPVNSKITRIFDQNKDDKITDFETQLIKQYLKSKMK